MHAGKTPTGVVAAQNLRLGGGSGCRSCAGEGGGEAADAQNLRCDEGGECRFCA